MNSQNGFLLIAALQSPRFKKVREFGLADLDKEFLAHCREIRVQSSRGVIMVTSEDGAKLTCLFDLSELEDPKRINMAAIRTMVAKHVSGRVAGLEINPDDVTVEIGNLVE